MSAGSANAFGTASAMTVAAGATLNLGGFNNVIGSLAGNGLVTNNGSASATLGVGADNTSTSFGGVIQDGLGPLV